MIDVSISEGNCVFYSLRTLVKLQFMINSYPQSNGPWTTVLRMYRAADRDVLCFCLFEVSF